jgi:hypothetical protein
MISPSLIIILTDLFLGILILLLILMKKVGAAPWIITSLAALEIPWTCVFLLTWGFLVLNILGTIGNKAVITFKLDLTDF